MDETVTKSPKKRLSGAAAMGAGPGRPKGSHNKLTVAVRDVIAQAAEDLGGKTRMVEWAREHPKNEHAFWTVIYPKLLPLQVTGAEGRTLAQELAALNGINAH